ncbi:unnamed protein product [Clonostachys chloroleuca]|uniref:Uncharacterized protein n=1 Tax=Clonostachys chloroleuca TaxID=1926264 RepID=A0AA35M557_9HYPO|nr:unnamed protein product [Clonostachys chloroleuca]
MSLQQHLATVVELTNLTGNDVVLPLEQHSVPLSHAIGIENIQEEIEPGFRDGLGASDTLYRRSVFSQLDDRAGTNDSEHSDWSNGQGLVADHRTLSLPRLSTLRGLSNASLIAAPPRPRNTTAQDAMNHHTINRQFGQMNAPDNGLKALQLPKEVLTNGDSLNHPRDAGQTTGSTTCHDALPSALGGINTKQFGPGRESFVNAQTPYAEVHALREPHPPDSNHHGSDNPYQDEPNQTISSENMRLRDDITKPFSGHGEYDFEASEHKPATDEVMVDADDDVHNCIGESTTMVSTSTEQSQPTATATDVDAEWEIDGDLMGKEVIDGEVYYLVPWKPTLVPANRMQNALGLINRFEARFGAQSDKSVEEVRVAKRTAMSRKSSKHSKDVTACRRGRPRKQRLENWGTTFECSKKFLG